MTDHAPWPEHDPARPPSSSPAAAGWWNDLVRGLGTKARESRGEALARRQRVLRAEIAEAEGREAGLLAQRPARDAPGTLPAAVLAEALGSPAKDVRVDLAAEADLAALRESLTLKRSAVDRLEAARPFVEFEDASAAAAARLPRFAVKARRLQEALEAAAVAYHELADETVCIQGEFATMEAALARVPVGACLHRPYPSEVISAGFDWADELAGRHDNPSKLAAWRADIDRLLAAVQ